MYENKYIFRNAPEKMHKMYIVRDNEKTTSHFQDLMTSLMHMWSQYAQNEKKMYGEKKDLRMKALSLRRKGRSVFTLEISSLCKI